MRGHFQHLLQLVVREVQDGPHVVFLAFGELVDFLLHRARVLSSIARDAIRHPPHLFTRAVTTQQVVLVAFGGVAGQRPHPRPVGLQIVPKLVPGAFLGNDAAAAGAASACTSRTVVGVAVAVPAISMTPTALVIASPPSVVTQRGVRVTVVVPIIPTAPAPAAPVVVVVVVALVVVRLAAPVGVVPAARVLVPAAAPAATPAAATARPHRVWRGEDWSSGTCDSAERNLMMKNQKAKKSAKKATTLSSPRLTAGQNRARAPPRPPTAMSAVTAPLSLASRLSRVGLARSRDGAAATRAPPSRPRVAFSALALVSPRASPSPIRVKIRLPATPRRGPCVSPPLHSGAAAPTAGTVTNQATRPHFLHRPLLRLPKYVSSSLLATGGGCCPSWAYRAYAPSLVRA